MSAQRFRDVVALVLTIGVSLSAILIAIGFIASLAVGWQGSLSGQPVAPGASATDFGQLGAGLAALRPLAIGQLGLLVLLATPIVRVATSLLGFALERDRLYMLVTGAVLAILLLSVFVLR